MKTKLYEFYDESFFTKFINKDCDYYIKDDDGNNKLLFSLKKNTIDPKKWTKVMDKIYVKNILHSNNRIIESSNESSNDKKQDHSLSGIIGYYNMIPPRWKTELPFNWAGRKTRYTREKEQNYNEIKKIATLVQKNYKEAFPNIFAEHKKKSSKIIPELKIGKTVFTTCTFNKNLRTSAHKDKGDLENVLSCLLCLGQNFTGCYLGFPKYKVAVKLQPGDLILMNSREFHCNTELNLNEKNSVRYTLVFYTRKNMEELKNKVRMKIVSDDVVYLSDKDFKRYKKLQT